MRLSLRWQPATTAAAKAGDIVHNPLHRTGHQFETRQELELRQRQLLLDARRNLLPQPHQQDMHDTSSVGHASGGSNATEHDGWQSGVARENQTQFDKQTPREATAGQRGMEPATATTAADATATTADVESAGNDVFPATDGDDGHANPHNATATTATANAAADVGATWTAATATTAGIQRDARTVREHAAVWKPAHDVKWRDSE